MFDFTQLAHFTGTENIYRHGFARKVTYTDGVKYVAEQAHAYWLLDLIASLQYDPKLEHEPFQTWTIKVTGSKATVVAEDGNGHVLYRHAIHNTDFPAPGITLCVEESVILLPSEH
jgi:hypothetical protein